MNLSMIVVNGFLPDQLDKSVPVNALPLVLDADSTQTSAVNSALTGRTFVLQGPPGTGKSQTITNMIAIAMAYGKTVLFVSEKTAALEVVHRRLQNIGLGDFCLELHSSKSSKKEVLQSFDRALQHQKRDSIAPNWKKASSELEAMRRSLNDYAHTLHNNHVSGDTSTITPYKICAKLMGLKDVPEIQLDVAKALPPTEDSLKMVLKSVHEFETVANLDIYNHPFKDCNIDFWSGQKDQEARDALTTAVKMFNEIDVLFHNFSSSIDCDKDLSLADSKAIADIASRFPEKSNPLNWSGDDDNWEELQTQLKSCKSKLDSYTNRMRVYYGRLAVRDSKINDRNKRVASYDKDVLDRQNRLDSVNNHHQSLFQLKTDYKAHLVSLERRWKNSFIDNADLDLLESRLELLC